MSKTIEFQVNQKTIFQVVGGDDFNFLSEIEIVYNRLSKEIILFKDSLIEGINTLQTTLNKVIESKLQVLNLGKTKGMGFLWNEYCHKLSIGNHDNDDLTAPFHIWSTNSAIGIDTWIYNIGDKIFIEISPTYRWHFDEPTDLDYITYEQFLSKYSPIDVIEIDNSIAKEWLKMCEDILCNVKQINSDVQ